MFKNPSQNKLSTFSLSRLSVTLLHRTLLYSMESRRLFAFPIGRLVIVIFIILLLLRMLLLSYTRYGQVIVARGMKTVRR